MYKVVIRKGIGDGEGIGEQEMEELVPE